MNQEYIVVQKVCLFTGLYLFREVQAVKRVRLRLFSSAERSNYTIENMFTEKLSARSHIPCFPSERDDYRGQHLHA